MSKQRTGEAVWSKMPKVNAELFTLTYGALVTQLIRDYEDLKQVNKQLDTMGYNIGTRVIDEFLAKSGVLRCSSFKDTAETIAKVAMKMFLGVSADVTNWNSDFTACSLIIHENPFADFVELPPHAVGLLWYSNILCGVLRGALEMIQMRVDAKFVKDVAQGDDMTEIKIEYKGMIEESISSDYKDN